MSAVVFYYRRSEFATDIVNLLSVVNLVREGPLGNRCWPDGGFRAELKVTHLR